MAANRNPPKTMDAKVLEYQDIFAWAFDAALTHLGKMKEMQNAYDQNIDSKKWPTVSEIPIPMMFVMVERALGEAVEYLFPTSDFLRLNPIYPGVKMESVRRSEWALQHMIRKIMALQQNSYATIKDCFRLGVGYGIIEPIMRSYPQAYEKIGMVGEEEVARTRTLGVSVPKRSLRYRYLAPGQVVPTPDGTDFNGDNRVSAAFFIDSYSAGDFEDLYKRDVVDGEQVKLKGDPKKIIEEAKTLGFFTRTSIVDVVAKLAGYDLTKTNDANQHIRPRVPVMKVYEKHKHTWIANGTTIILEEEEDAQTLRCPLLKCSAWPDGLRWYPMSTPEATYKLAMGANVFVNAMFDLITEYMKPAMLYDKTKFGSKAPERGPNSMIGVSGSIDQAMGHLRGPEIPVQLFTVGDMCERLFSDGVGQRRMLEQGQAGLMRGGAFAFEDYLRSSSGRSRLAGAILETGWLESACYQTLILMQSIIGPDGETFVVRKMGDNKEAYIDEMSVTENDLVNAYTLELDLAEKFKSNSVSFAQRAQDFQIGNASPYTDKYQVYVEYYGNEAKARRLLKSQEEIERIEAQQRALQMAQETAARTAGPQPGMAEQGLMGAGAAALAGGAA
uniref:Portal protein n=1 Tax=viral metagenome TaxID=1070528 RepID=A0A6M3L7V5_9ZZZZ